LKLATDVPAGKYEKIRLGIKDVRIEGGECGIDGIDIKLPSGRIDVNPRGTFEVIPGETLLISLDVDAEKSINLHKAGKSGKCIFRPVVFADIKYGDVPPKICPEIISGKITALFEEGEDDKPGFYLFNKDQGTVEVILTDETVVYDGSFVESDKWFEVLKEARKNKTLVKVRGALNDEARLEASVVGIGDILDVKGVVTAAMIEEGAFFVKPDSDEELTDEFKVALDDDRILILSGCDQLFDPFNIVEGMRVRLFGKYNNLDDVFEPVAVLVKSQLLGKLREMEFVSFTDGFNLSVQFGDQTPEVFILPPSASVFVGSAKIQTTAWKALSDRVNCRTEPDWLNVALKTDPEAIEPTVEVMKISAESVSGEVVYIDEKARKIELKDDLDNKILVKLVDDPIIHKNSSSSDLDDIDVGDDVTAYGLEACPSDAVDFYAYIVLASDDDD
jgi:hypothetical protein